MSAERWPACSRLAHIAKGQNNPRLSDAMPSVAVPTCLDLSGITVITGGASGFGLVVAKRLLNAGAASIAILDVSRSALDSAGQELRAAGATHDSVRCPNSRTVLSSLPLRLLAWPCDGCAHWPHVSDHVSDCGQPHVGQARENTRHSLDAACSLH
jgi:hypothetical protein